MTTLLEEKLAQAVDLVAASDIDVWLTFVRETAEAGDPILPFLVEEGLTWQSALLIGRYGHRIAIVGNYDADALRASGNWNEVIPYVESIREPLRKTLDRMIPNSPTRPRIAVNYSENDVKADGLSHGMYLLLQKLLHGTRFADSLVSAEPIVTALRSRKTAVEIQRIREAIVETEELFALLATNARIGMSERDVYTFVQGEIDSRRLGFSWPRHANPIVNSGPDSMIGHGAPSDTIRLAPGHIFHIDLGITKSGYSSDIQRCWYIPEANESRLPIEIQQALDAVHGAITAGSAVLRPGISGWEVDQAARKSLTAAGYPEYLHAFGHQVGRVAHDGGAILGPRWDRYGQTPYMPLEAGQVYTLELGVFVEGRGYLGLEEMVEITADGFDWLTTRQLTLPFLVAS